jgi:hypothetical protein
VKKAFLYTILWLSTSIIFAQQLFINEFSSLNTLLQDEDRDTPDWFELYNPGDQALNLNGWAVSDDSTDLAKWLFPSINLSAKSALLIFASDKDRKEIIFYDNIIQQGDTFAYKIGSADISTDWKSLTFDASAWDNGPSGFGYGDNDDATLIPEGTLSVFVRKEFQITEPNSISEILLHVDYDDGFVAYLNGSEIARANLGTPNTEVPYNQTADNYVEPLIINGQAPEKFDLSAFLNLLVQGTNVLSIQVHNNSNTSSDITLIPFLTLGYTAPISQTNEMPEILGLSQKYLHANFKLNADGEYLYLINPQGLIADKTDSVALPPNISYGRFADGASTWFYFGEPTPGTLNLTNAYDTLTESPVVYSKPGGVYSSEFSLSLSAPNADAIYYTTDGSEPNASDSLYKAPISISASTAIRAYAANSQLLSVNPSVETYVIENRTIKLPILSITSDPYNLWDYNYGIYVLGPNAESDNPYYGANFWMDWERPVQLELMDTDGKKVFESSAGTKIFGAWSRAVDQKSMAFFARTAYGNKSFEYPFFSERENTKYKSFIIRNSGNDWSYTTFRDAMMTGLLEEIDIDRQAYQPAVIYLNGAYWGLLNMREKINEDYLENRHTNVDADQVDILEGNAVVVEGSSTHYIQMLNFIRSNNIETTAVYDSVKQLMDVINFMEYEIAEIYFNNTDWPGNNIKYWRPQTTNGRWRWLIYDTDFGFGIYGANDYENNTLQFATETSGPSWPNPPWSTYLLRTLLLNPDFKSEFINRFADRINCDFSPQKVTQLVDSLKGNIAEEIPYHIARWNHIRDFDANVTRLKTFGSNRPNYMRGFINSEFNLGGSVYLKMDVSDESQGYVQVSSLTLKTGFPWTGKYFKNNPVRVSAIAKPGYEFSHWEGLDSNKSSELVSLTATTTTIKAVFKTSVKEYNSIVINEINYKSADTKNCGDWVELFNTTSGPLNIGGWVFKDSDNSHSFVVPAGTTIDSKAYLVLYESDSKFNSVYGNLTNTIGSFEFGLSSTEDAVRLFDNTGNLIDSVLYMADDPWPVIDKNDGKTLSLITPYKNNEPYYRWEKSADYGTPGAQNDNYNSIPAQKSQTKILASAFPNPFNEQLTIRWKCDQPTQITIQLFDIKGSLIAQFDTKKYPAGTFENMFETDAGLQSGFYYLKIDYGISESQTIKLIKQ